MTLVNNNEYRERSYLIIGGTGSVGEIVVGGLIDDGVTKIKILARDETKHQEIQDRYRDSSISVQSIIGDIKDTSSLQKAFEGVDVVVHAAAMKHVKYCHEFPNEAYKSNVVGIKNSLELAKKNKISSFVFISSDKAAEFTTYYGKTKYIAEKLVRNYRNNNCTYTSIRLGNVLGARNSVLPRVLKQYLRKDVIYINHSHTRFVMRPQDVYSLVKIAINNPHDASLYIWKMPSVKVYSLIMTFVNIIAANNKIKPVVRFCDENIVPNEKVNEILFTKSELPKVRSTDLYYYYSPGYKKLPNNAYVVNDSSEEPVHDEVIEGILRPVAKNLMNELSGIPK